MKSSGASSFSAAVRLSVVVEFPVLLVLDVGIKHLVVEVVDYCRF